MEGTRQNRANIVIDDSGSPLLTRDTEFIHVLYNETTNSLVCTTKDRYLIVVVLSFLYLVGIPKRILLKSISCVSGWKNSTLCSKCMLEPIFSLKSRILSLLLPLQTYSQIRHRLSCLICKIIHQSSSMYFLFFLRITIQSPNEIKRILPCPLSSADKNSSPFLFLCLTIDGMKF